MQIQVLLHTRKVSLTQETFLGPLSCSSTVLRTGDMKINNSAPALKVFHILGKEADE